MGIAGFKCCFTALASKLSRDHNLLHRLAAGIEKNPDMIIEGFLFLPATRR
jgi:hypothetical protein